MNANDSKTLSALLFSAFIMYASVAGATTQTISASANVSGSTTGTAPVSSPAVVTCTQASGGTYGTKCSINAPGINTLMDVGQSIGTSGPGTVTLKCYGQYGSSGGLNCKAKIDDSLCSPEQTISASSSLSGSTNGFAPVKSAAVVECTQASGGIYGTQCSISAPGYTGYLNVGQSIGTSAAGTINLHCAGQYNTNGALSCKAHVSQVCP